jgi:hypothetical protein
MLRIVATMLRTLLDSAHIAIKCIFRSRCCNKTEVEEPIQVVNVFNVFDCNHAL